jgi:Asp-tRNA(Asn)/Glu-tRNA(Gln) amidotransferase A subunit family amidase
VLAQGRGAGGAAGAAGATGAGGAAQAALAQLGNGEPVAWTFQPYPGGTGVLMEKLIRERGGAAFDRKPFEVERWTGPVPTAEEDIAFLPAHRLSALIKEKRITSTQLTKIYLDRIKRYDPTLLCAVTIMEQQGMAEAAAADREIAAGRYRGALHGIPYGIKDLFATKGVRTTWGSADFENRIIDEDSEIVVRLREAGAVLIAKLSTGMFAQGDQWYRGRTNDPWDVRKGSSGSSAGPGSATAAGCVAFAIGTETNGSIVSPTSACGISALRPTFGRVSRHGGMVLSWSQDRVGPMCRTIEDCAIVFNVIHGSDPKDPSTLTMPFEFKRLPNLNGLRVGFAANSPEPFLTSLREMGAELKELPAMPTVPTSGFGVESAAAFDYWVGEKAREAEAAGETPTGRFMGGGRTTTALEYMQGQRRRLIMMQKWEEALDGFDVMIGGLNASNTTGHPAVVVPYAFESTTNNEGVVSPAQPRTVTIFGNLFEDDVIINVAHAYQIKHDWHARHPSLQS